MNVPVRVLFGGLSGAVAGFLTRPCCVIPAALSLLGVGGTGLAQAVVAHRPALASASAVLLGASIWITFRREGGWFPKTLAASATIIAFAFSASSMGLF